MALSRSGKVPTGYAQEVVVGEVAFRNAQRSSDNSVLQGSKKRKREAKGDVSKIYGTGAYRGPWAKYEERAPDAGSDEEDGVEVEIVYEEDEIEEQPAAAPSKAGTDYAGDLNGKETTEFHGAQLHDYQGRTYMHVPQDLDIKLSGDISDLKNYCPKKVIKTWKEHTHAVNQMRFFPSSGHLLLSCSADTKIKLFDVYHQRELLRTYAGHIKSVSDICFNNAGDRFLSASYDRQMKLWDTETGQCISRYSTGKTPHVIRFNPDPALNHEFVAGMSDKKIVQFDTRADSTKDNDPIQEYDHHLAAVNTITFCDNNRRFITTSDDKSLRAWEYGIPVPIKFIAEPYMYPMVRSSAHPNGKYVAFQSSDNQIVVYASTERFRQNRKKGFRGHNNAGYAIDVAISPDGSLVMSGDSAGYVCWWDWKTCQMYRKEKAGDAAVLSCAWHPKETSKVATGDVNGVIKYWD